MFVSSGTLNEPLVTTNVLLCNPALTHVPDPEKVPLAFVLEIDAMVTVPDSRPQKKLGSDPVSFAPMIRTTAVQAFAEHSTLTVELPAV